MNQRHFVWIFASMMIAACGGSSGLAPVSAPMTEMQWQTEEMNASSLRELTSRDDLSAEEAYVASFVYELEGNPLAAAEVLLETEGFDDPALAAARAVRLYMLRNVVPDYPAIVGDWASDRAQTAHPIEQVMRAELDYGMSYRAHRYEMTEELFDAPHLGSPEEWAWAGPFSYHAHVDIDRAFAPDEEVSLAERYELPGTSFDTLYLPVRAAGAPAFGAGRGIFYLESFMQTDAEGEFLFATSSDASYRVFVDGELVAARGVNDMFLGSVRIHRLQLDAGIHRVLVRLGGSSNERPFWIRVVPTGEAMITRFDAEPGTWSDEGVIAHSPIEGTRLSDLIGGVPTDSLAGWLAQAELALISRDAMAAEEVWQAREALGDDPIVAYVSSLLAITLYHRTASEQTDLAIEHLMAAASLWPDAAGIQAELGARFASEMLDTEAREALEEAQRLNPDNFKTLRELALLYGFEGFDELARAARQRAAIVFPDHCPNLGDVLDDWRDQYRIPTPDNVPEAWMHCDVTIDRLINAYYMPRGMTDEALELSARLAMRNPTNDSYYERWIDLAWSLGARDEVNRALELADRYLEQRLDLMFTALDLELAQGNNENADRVMRRVLEEHPEQLITWSVDAFLRDDELLSELRVDGLESVRDYEANRGQYDGNLAYIHDYAATRYFPDGSAVEVVHQILQPLTRDAIAALGEVGVPEDSLLLTVRTIKSDGRVFVPEDIAGKESISMPNIEVGDYIELEYAVPIYPGDPDDVGVRSSRFYFRVMDGPLYRSIARYDYPASWHDDVIFELRNFDGTRDDIELGDFRGSVFTVLDSMPPIPEPASPPLEEWLPSVRFGYGIEWTDVARLYADVVPRVTVPTHFVADRTAEIVDGIRNPRERAQAIFRFVNDDIESFSGFFSDHAVTTLLAEEGDRLALTWAMLREAGFDPQLVFVRPADVDQSELQIVDENVFDLTTIRVMVGGEEVWLEPEFDEYPFDYLRIEAQGRPALVVAGPEAGAHITTPVWPMEAERTERTTRFEMNPMGDASATSTERLGLRSSSSMRFFVASIDDMSLLVQELEGGLSTSYPSVTLGNLEFEREDEHDEPMLIHYDFDTLGLAQVEGDSLVVDRPFSESPYSGAFATEEERDLPLAINNAFIDRSEFVLVPPDGYRFDEWPEDQSWTFGDNEISRTYTIDEEGALHFVRMTTIPIQRVSPDDYPEFASFLRSSEADARLYARIVPQ